MASKQPDKRAPSVTSWVQVSSEKQTSIGLPTPLQGVLGVSTGQRVSVLPVNISVMRDNVQEDRDR